MGGGVRVEIEWEERKWGQGFCYYLIWALETPGPKDLAAPPHLFLLRLNPPHSRFCSLYLPYKQGWSSIFPLNYSI